MMQSVVLDGNPLNEYEYMRLLACVVLDRNKKTSFLYIGVDGVTI